MERRRNSEFQLGAGVFTCTCCGRRTRGNRDSVDLELCAECCELAEQDNRFNDCGEVPNAKELAHFDELLERIGERGGNVERVKKTNPYIWVNEGDKA